ncbi:alkaline phosphatase family protein [Halovivax cerinus]|uniref:Alkaline phosphatase family protein n=1 Tax=Halovivax cerinus TaxID=1487865 RepID=A0ABD5NT66_9EURY|nr:alkaline phosphatase family protein [Halovivax cerinus]
MTENHPRKAFVLGIDGVPWKLLESWANACELEHIRQLITEGAAGPLQSTAPPTTPLAWPSIATGTWPDKHGIYGFHRLESDYTHRMYTGSDRTRPALWDMLSPAVAGNVPMTYPASEIDGAMVSGMISPSTDGEFAQPPALREAIESEIPGYQIELDWNEYTDSPSEFVDDVRDLVATRRRLMRLLERRYEWRLFFFVYTAPDRLQHLIWDEEVLLDHYRLLDEIVGEAMERAEAADATLYIVSDHGFGPISTFVNLNTVLAENGFLSRKANDGARGSLSKLGVNKSSVLQALDRAGITPDTLVDHLPASIVSSVAERIPGDHGLYDVDFDETVAFAHDPSQIYINDTGRFERGTVSPSDVEAVKEDVRTALSNVTDPETGERALAVHDGSELFESDPTAPDLIAVGRGEYEEKTSVAEDAFVPAGTKAASHRSEGMFLAWGDAIVPGTTVPDASVVDVAPTVLHGAGEPVPEQTDGRILTEIFTAAVANERSISRRRYESVSDGTVADEPSDDFDGVEDRLRGLGYLE